MDKAVFLKELKKYLAILNECEQKDILDEYTQHIDMKMENGMSEAEAIRDFGDIGELAAEILEAYHVNPQYGNKKRIKLIQRDELPVKELKETGAHVWKRVAGAVKKLCFGMWGGIKKVARILYKPFVLTKEAWKHKKEAGGDLERNRSDNPQIQKKIMAGNMIGKAGYGMSKFLRAILFFTVTCVRWLWNGCMIFSALITGGLTLFGVFYLGAMAVLLLQGYPLFGITLASVGAVICCGAGTVLIISLIRRKETQIREPEVKEIAVQEVLEHA